MFDKCGIVSYCVCLNFGVLFVVLLLSACLVHSLFSLFAVACWCGLLIVLVA